jgi:hypothetical protein
MARVLHSDINPWARTLVDATDDGEGIVIRHEEDVTDLLEINDRQRIDVGKGLGTDMRPVARISGLLLAELIHQGIIDKGCGTVLDESRFRRWLNDRDNRRWRTSEGKV